MRFFPTVLFGAFALMSAQNIVTNIVEWDGVTPYKPDGTLTPVGDLPGGIYIGAELKNGAWEDTRPPPQQRLPDKTDLLVQKLIDKGVLTEQDASGISIVVPVSP